MSLLDLEEFALSKSIDNTTDGGDESLLDGEGLEQLLDELPQSSAEPDEEIVEDLLSAKLMNGFMLIDKPCPRCLIPLVKKPYIHDANSQASSSISSRDKDFGAFQIVSNETIHEVAKPIKGVPYCVLCDSYVLTNHNETRVLERLQAIQILGRDEVAMIPSDENTLDTKDLRRFSEGHAQRSWRQSFARKANKYWKS